MFSVTRRKEKLFQAEKECVQHNTSFVGINVRSFGQQTTEILAVMQDINLLLNPNFNRKQVELRQ